MQIPEIGGHPFYSIFVTYTIDYRTASWPETIFLSSLVTVPWVFHVIKLCNELIF